MKAEKRTELDGEEYKIPRPRLPHIDPGRGREEPPTRASDIGGGRLAKKLETTDDPGLRSIADDLRELKELLAAEETFDDPAVGRKLLELGERAQAVAVSGTATPVADKLQLLSHLLTEEGRSLLEGEYPEGR